MIVNLYMLGMFIEDRINSNMYSGLTITKDFNKGLRKKLKILK